MQGEQYRHGMPNGQEKDLKVSTLQEELQVLVQYQIVSSENRYASYIIQTQLARISNLYLYEYTYIHTYVRTINEKEDMNL